MIQKEQKPLQLNHLKRLKTMKMAISATSKEMRSCWPDSSETEPRNPDMKRNIILLLILFTSAYVFGQDEPMPSPQATVIQKVGMTNITIEYFRSGLKGRDMYESLTPEGKIW